MGLSLNGVLMTGPDLVNSMMRALLRFRQEPVAISSDIEQMFYQFYVEEKDRNYLRFFWFKDNNPNMAIIEYRMCVYVFGNSPLPLIATYGLESAKYSESMYGSDVTEFVCKNFHIDDGKPWTKLESESCFSFSISSEVKPCTKKGSSFCAQQSLRSAGICSTCCCCSRKDNYAKYNGRISRLG